MNNFFYGAFMLLLMSMNHQYASSISIAFEKSKYLIDHHLKIIVCTYKPIAEHDLRAADSVYVLLEKKMLLKAKPQNLVPSASYFVIDTMETSYELFFTQIPLLNIATSHEIIDESKASAYITINDTSQTSIKSYIGIEIRGASSQSWPKKKYEIEFWVDSLGTYTWDLPLMGMRKDKDWILEAMYNEPMRIRSFTNWHIWAKTHKLYYADTEKDAKPFINNRYVEVFINGSYKGIYALTEKIDRKQLQLKRTTTSKTEGELFKSYDWGQACQFISCPPYANKELVWGGYEMKYPNETDTANWQNLYSFTDFVVNGSETDFSDSFKNRFVWDNAVDYYIFLNLLAAYDNSAKNVYVAKYDQTSPYFYVPWDLDGTWGIFWDGVKHEYYNVVIGNRMYDRLFKESNHAFQESLEQRWNILRSSIYKEDSLISFFKTNRDALLHNNIYRREHIAWPQFNYQPSDFDELDRWVKKRLIFLDDYFKFSKDIVTNTFMKEYEKGYKIFPNPVTSVLHIDLDHNVGKETIYVMTLDGKVLITQEVKGSSTLSLERLPKGVYGLKIGPNTEKLIVDKQ
jgi:spore coat protein H